MLPAMKIFITAQQKTELERLHDSSRDGRVRDRIKAILLASKGWSSAMIAQALRLHQTTVDHHISEFLNKGKLKPENGGSDSKLSAEQRAFLISQLSNNLFHHTRDIIAFFSRTWDIVFSVPGMNKWLHRNGFTYKKPSGVPHKFSEEKQRQFIEYYEELKATAGDEPVLFIDAVHPTQATKISYGWIRKGHKKAVKTTGSRTRLNIMGTLNLKTLATPLICEYKTINEYNVSTCAVGNANLKICIRGNVINVNGKLSVHVDALGFYLKDTYDFLDDNKLGIDIPECLGIWGKNRILNKIDTASYMTSYASGSFGILVQLYSGFVPVFNSDFREWQKKTTLVEITSFFLMYYGLLHLIKIG